MSGLVNWIFGFFFGSRPAPATAPLSLAAGSFTPRGSVAAAPGKVTMKTSYAGLTFIAGKEGWSSVLYNDADTPPNATIGYGHLVHYGPVDGSESAEFRKGISKVRGMQILQEDVKTAEDVVNRYVLVALSQKQFDALVSFVFNVGQATFLKSSVLKYANLGDFDQVQNSMLLYNKSGGLVLAGLTTRRKEEAAAFA